MNIPIATAPNKSPMFESRVASLCPFILTIYYEIKQ